MPTVDKNGKRESGARQRAKAKAGASEMAHAKPLPKDLRDLLGQPPDDDLHLQLWGARLAATLAWIALTRPRAISREQLSQVQRYLATLGMLFPRSEMVARLKKAAAKSKAQKDEKEVRPLDGLAPGPASRRRRTG